MPKVTIKEDGKEMTVFYPSDKDKGYEEAIRTKAIEKTKEDLKKRPAKKKRVLTSDEKGAIKDFNKRFGQEIQKDRQDKYKGKVEW